MHNQITLVAIALSLAASCVRPGTAPAGSSPTSSDASSPTRPAASSIEILVVATTDVHGRLRGWNYEINRPDTLRGLTRAATIVDSVRRAAPGRVILLDAGDLLQGNSLTYVAARIAPDAPHPVMAAMNAMHYDAAAVGNHEFNYGLPFFERAIAQATFPFLAANAYRPDGTHAVRSWVMVERGGARIAIVGATTPGSMVWDRDNLAGRLRIGDIVPAVRAAVSEARAAGAHAVLVTMHSGLNEPSSYDTVTTGVPSENAAERVAREVPGIDLVLYGHSHKEMPDTLINGVLLMQPKNWATSVAIAHITLASGASGWHVERKRSGLVQAVGHPESPAVLAATDAAHRSTVAWVTAPIGRTPVAWHADSARVTDTPLIDFVNEVERRASGADLASSAAFSLDASLDSGAITPGQLQALYPYDNTLRAIRISGRQLREYLEQSARYYRTGPDGAVSVDPTIPGYNFDIVSGVDYTLDVSGPVGQRVTRLERNGKAVAPTDSFTMALNNYRQTGGGGYAMLSGAPVVYDKQQEIRQLLIDEVRRRGTIAPAHYFTRNWRLEPLQAVGTLYQQLRRENREDAHAAGGAPTVVPPRGPRPATRLRLLSTNDVHGALEPRSDNAGVRRGGLAYLATAIATARAGCVSPACETLLVDGGDEMQGTPASNLAFGRPIVELFNELGYSAAAVGNHEFDWGQDTLRARMRQARYAFLGANVRYADGRDVPWIRDDTLITRGALKIGVIGVATRLTPTTTRASNVADLRFLDPAPIVDSLARRLRARGAGYVVLLAHDGAFCDRDGAANCKGEIVDLARRLTEPVDAIVSGHTHSLVNTDVSGIPIVQARLTGTALAVVDLGPDGTSHHVVDVLTDSITPDPTVAAHVRDAVARVAPIVNQSVATIERDLNRDGNQYPLGNLIADAMRSVGQSDVAVMNNGGIRTRLRAGPATYGSLFEIMPFANALYRYTLTGSALRDYLERLVAKRPSVHVSGVVVTYDSTAVEGARISSVKLADGSPLRADGHYTLVLNDFLASGGEGLALGARAIKSEVLPDGDLDAFVAYLRARPQPVQAPTDVRLVATGAAR
jgi:2',3'-cyclic-nucleotide 2'-phosphodiesterase (5'-nucleotidase family)